MRGLRRLGVGCAGPEPLRWAENLAGTRVEAHLVDAGDGAPARAVGVPGQVRVDAGNIGQPHRIRPRPGRIGGGEQQVAAVADVRHDQPEPAVVVAERGRVDPRRRRRVEREAQLARPVQGVADLRPVQQIAAVEDRHPREVLETGAGEVVVVADAADRRVGVKPGDDRVAGGGGRLVLVGHPSFPSRAGWPLFWSSFGTGAARRRAGAGPPGSAQPRPVSWPSTAGCSGSTRRPTAGPWCRSRCRTRSRPGTARTGRC